MYIHNSYAKNFLCISETGTFIEDYKHTCNENTFKVYEVKNV